MDPKKNEIVICTVKKVLPHSIFLKLDEYPDYEGMLHISELAYKFVKNINTYAKVGKTMICKIIDINKTKKQVDLSLRRVKEFEKKKKLNDWRLEKRAQKLLELAAENYKINFKKIAKEIKEDYGGVKVLLEDLSLIKDYVEDESIAKKIMEFISKSLQTKTPKIKYKLEIYTTRENGIDIIKSFCSELLKTFQKENLISDITYLGAPNYQLTITVKNIKEDERKIKQILNQQEGIAKKQGLYFNYSKKK